jgi:DNA-binding transcriptional ArsR family regulator
MTEALARDNRSETEDLLLELLDMPISFHRCFVAITGKVTAALLLSYLWWAANETGAEPEGWIARPLEHIRDETGLSRDELSGARRILRERAILEDRRRGIPPIVEFRIDRIRVAHLLLDQAHRQRGATGLASAANLQPLPRSAH